MSSQAQDQKSHEGEKSPPVAVDVSQDMFSSTDDLLANIDMNEGVVYTDEKHFCLLSLEGKNVFLSNN